MYWKMKGSRQRWGYPKGIWVRRATWEESLGSQSVSKLVSETGPLLDKRGVKEKVKKRASLTHFALTFPCSLVADEFPN